MARYRSPGLSMALPRRTLEYLQHGAEEGMRNAEPFDAILLDAPCSATGVIRRHPDIKLLRRASDIDEFGAICALFCSAHAGYITGQNILLDGGLFNSSI